MERMDERGNAQQRDRLKTLFLGTFRKLGMWPEPIMDIAASSPAEHEQEVRVTQTINN